jgi:TolB protein
MMLGSNPWTLKRCWWTLAGGGALVLLTTAISPPHVASGAFPGKNGRIFYEKHVRSGDTQIWSAPADGTHKRRVVGGDALNFQPSVSPDGQRVAFFQQRRNRASVIMRVDASGENLVRLGTSIFDQFDPAFSGPRGRRIAYVRSQGYGYRDHIWLMASDGSSDKKLTFGARNESDPAFSPDGHHIAFSRASPEHPRRRVIYSMRDDGAHVRPLTESSPGADGEPDYSPNGKHIVFRRSPPGKRPRIAIMRANGTHIRTLTHGYDMEPAFSPNGRKIVFDRGTKHGTKLFIMRRDGTHQHLVTGGQAPSWSVRP